MIYLTLFISFFEIGLFTFGGGYAMISLIRDTVLTKGWMTEEELLDIFAVSESTPGPFAINVATFIGSTQGGILGSFVATLGVVLPSFIIILLICIVLKNLTKYEGVQAFVEGIRPCVIALILSTALILFLKTIFNFSTIESSFSPDFRKLIILAIIVPASLLLRKLLKKKYSPILLILLSALLGIILYSI